MHTIRRWREVVAGRLASSLSNEFRIVSSPDHPLLVDAPDILVASSGRILAIFFPSRVEASRPDRFEQRIKLSRAALPPHTVFAGAGLHNLKGDAQNLFLEDFSTLNYYDEKDGARSSVSEKDISALTKLASESRKIRTRDAEIGRDIFERFSAALRANRITVGYKSLNRRKRTTHTVDPIFGSRDAGSPNADLRYKILDGSSVRLAVYSHFGASWLRVDEDFVAPEANDFRTVFVSEVKDRLADPEKYLRALSFSGWLAIDGSEDWKVARILESRNRRF